MKLKPLSSAIVASLFACQAYAISETTVYQYHYDSNGNTVSINQVVNQESKTLYAYSYNDLNQLSGFEDIVNNKSFTYDYYPNGKRLSKHGEGESSQEEIIFYYGHQGQLINELYSKNNETIKQSSYFAGLRFIDDLINSNDSHLQYPIADQHNHPATINFTQDDTTIESYQLTDYGQLAQSNTKREDKQVTELGIFNFEINPKIYGSGYYDSESNLQYMGARYYSADTQRFMAQDSYNLLNRYNYANANPVMNYDPDGHKSKVIGYLKEIGKALIPHSLLGAEAFSAGIAADFLANAGLAMIGVGNPLVIGIAAGIAAGSASSLVEQGVGDHGKYDIKQILEQGLITGAFSGAIIGPSGFMSGAFLKLEYKLEGRHLHHLQSSFRFTARKINKYGINFFYKKDANTMVLLTSVNSRRHFIPQEIVTKKVNKLFNVPEGWGAEYMVNFDGLRTKTFMHRVEIKIGPFRTVKLP